MLKHKTKSQYFIYFILIICSANAYCSVITYSTGDFIDSEWTSVLDPSSTGTSIASTPLTGGNPGAFRLVELSVNPFQFVQNNQVWSASAYTPSTDGAVTNISVSFDITRIFTSNPGATQVAAGLVVVQNGVVHTNLLGSTTVSQPVWETISVSDITPLFPLIDFISGNTITFGFFDNVATSSTGFTISGGYDNFELKITSTSPPSSVPLPPTIFLFGLGILFILKNSRSTNANQRS